MSRTLLSLSLGSVRFYLAGSLVLCATLGYASHLIADASERRMAQAQRALMEAASRLETDRVASRERANDMGPNADWPERASIDALEQAMSEQAIVNGVVLRTLLVSRGAPSASTWGKVSLEIAASGRYADLKNWQNGLLAGFPSLAVQSLRLQPAAGGPMPLGGVEAQMVWVLYVRD